MTYVEQLLCLPCMPLLGVVLAQAKLRDRSHPADVQLPNWLLSRWPAASDIKFIHPFSVYCVFKDMGCTKLPYYNPPPFCKAFPHQSSYHLRHPTSTSVMVWGPVQMTAIDRWMPVIQSAVNNSHLVLTGVLIPSAST